MDDKCRNCDDKQACIPFFAHENTMMHYNHANKRMLIAMITVCVTFVLTILVFVLGYTEREKNWLNTLARMNVTEVAENGVYEQPNP